MKNLSDSELVEKCLDVKSRGFLAFNEVVRRYEPLVFGFSLKYLKNAELAQEASQEAFLKVYGKLNTLKDPAQLKSWIMRIASNTCVNLYRKRKRKQEVYEQVRAEFKEDSASEPPSELAEKLDLLKTCIAQLKEGDRDILMLHYFSELSVREVAEQLELSPSAVKMRLSRCRGKIQKTMERKM